MTPVSWSGFLSQSHSSDYIINQVNSLRLLLPWLVNLKYYPAYNLLIVQNNVLLVSALNFVKEVSTVCLKESLVTDKQVRFGRDQPFMSALASCPPYSGVHLEGVYCITGSDAIDV